jgi:mono/diheme cytochrome c family protein
MLRQITYGSKIMPAFGDSLSKPEIDALIAYLRSCRDKHIQ